MNTRSANPVIPLIEHVDRLRRRVADRVALELHNGLAMEDIKRDDLSNVTGGAGGSAALRDGIKLIKTAGKVDPFRLGQASYNLEHAVGNDVAHMNKARAWLGGSSVGRRIDQFLSAFPR